MGRTIESFGAPGPGVGADGRLGPARHVIGIMAKWFMNPGQALTARELARGLQIIAQHMKGKDL